MGERKLRLPFRARCRMRRRVTRYDRSRDDPVMMPFTHCVQTPAISASGWVVEQLEQPYPA